MGFRKAADWHVESGALECLFLEHATAQNILYAFVADRVVLYVGKTVRTLKQRMYGYRRPVPTQSTNLKGNRLILEALAEGRAVTAKSLDTTWGGVSLSHLAEVAQLKPAARFVVFHSEYGFTSNVPLEVALDPQAMVAWNYDGKPLEPDHGYPLRAIVPGRYFWKSAKWLRGVEFSAEDRPGFWERNGYSNSADPWREERYADG